MAIGHISTYAVFQNTLRDLSNRQLDLFNLQNQISSGQKSQDFAGIASQSQQFLDLETKISKIDRYLENNGLASSRLQITSSTLDRVIQTATSIKNLIASRRSGTQIDQTTFDQQLTNQWKTLVSQLNTQSEGRYLFAGASTDVKPVEDTTFPVLIDPSVPDDGYYHGSKQDITLRIQDNVDITYNTRADDTGLQQIFAGIAEAKRGNDFDSDAILAAAYDYIDQGIQGVITQQATVNANKIAIDDVNSQHQSFKLYWKGVKEEIGNTDIVSASTQVAINEGILQAAFQAFARINSLKLADFLR